MSKLWLKSYYFIISALFLSSLKEPVKKNLKYVFEGTLIAKLVRACFGTICPCGGTDTLVLYENKTEQSDPHNGLCL